MILTDWLILGIVAFIAVSDLWLMWAGLPTYSRSLRELGKKVSFFPYAWGVIGGHFWGPIEKVFHVWWQVLLLLLGLGIAVSLAGLVVQGLHLRRGHWLPLLLYLPIGLCAGAVIWAQ